MRPMTNDPNCIFCKIAAGEVASFKLLEDAKTFAFMDINPANPGHALVISKAHYPDVYKVPAPLIAACARTAKKVAKALHKTLAPDGLNLVQSNGPGAAQSVRHFHLHVLPRHKGDGLPLNWGFAPGDRDQIAALAARIQEHL
jgi:histidine triad (HIT) family protein